MKKMVLLFITSFTALAFMQIEVRANSQSADAAITAAVDTVTQDSVKRTLIDPIDLPQSIQRVLSEDEYADWMVLNVYYVETEGEDPYYEVSLQQEGKEDVRIVLFKADGTLRNHEE